MNKDELLSKTISYIRFPLTVLIVFIHFNLFQGLNIRGTVYGLDNPDWYFFIVTIISQVIAKIGVPLFFVISGFLFFYNCDFDRHIYKRKIRSRIVTLFVPFLAWNIIAIFWKLKCFIPVLSSFYRPVELKFSFVRLFNTFFCNCNNSGIIITAEPEYSAWPINVPLWFVRDLMVMVLLSPIVYWLIKKFKKCILVILFLLWISVELIMQNLGGYISMLLTASFFFSWGAYFSINRLNIVLYFRKCWYFPCLYFLIAIIDTLTKGTDYSIYIHRLGIIFGVITALIIVSYLIESERVKVNETLSGSSFFIYAFHWLFISEVGKLVFTILEIPDNNPYAMLTLYFAVPAFCVIVCLAFYITLRRYFPLLFRILTGGR